MRERRRGRGRPPTPEHLKCGPGRYVRFPLKLDAAIEVMRKRIQEEVDQRGEMRVVEISEAIRRLTHMGAVAAEIMAPNEEPTPVDAPPTHRRRPDRKA